MFDYDYFIVKINTIQSRLVEISYTNNEGYTPIKPDLIVPSIQVLSIHSSNVEFEVEVQNIGGHVADLSGVTFQAFLSIDDELGYGDKAVGGWPISPPAELLPGETITKIYSGGTPGQDFQMYHYLIGIIDFNSALQETDEGNNQSEGEIPCFIFLPMTIQP